MASSFVIGTQPAIYNSDRQLRGYHPGSDGNDIGIVVLLGQPSTDLVPAEAASNASYLVRYNCLPVAAAAEDDAYIILACRNAFGGWANEVRIIDRLRAARTKIIKFITFFNQMSLQYFFKLISGVVRSDGNSKHAFYEIDFSKNDEWNL